MISISQRDLRKLMSSRHRIPAFHGRGSRDRVTRAVADDFGDDISRAVDALARQRLISLDDVSCALLEDHGVNPGVTAALRAEIHSFTINGQDWRSICEISDQFMVRLGTSEAWWNAGHGLITGLDAVPETMVGELAGKPLSVLLSHPVLDRFDLRISEVEAHRGTQVTVTGHGWLTEEMGRYSRPLRERGEPASTAG